MKKSFFIVFMIGLLNLSSFAMAENIEYQKKINDLQSFYNKSEINTVRELFSEEMKPLVTEEYFNSLRTQFGKIQKIDLIKENKDYSVFKVKFSSIIFLLSVSLDKNSKINAFRFSEYVDISIPILERTKTKMILPFKNEWTVLWGGDTEDLNYHVISKAQKNAFDILKTDEKGQSHKNNGSKNEDYFAFGEEIISPCDGEVVLAVNGIKDNKPGKMNPIFALGNVVVIKTKNNEFLYFCHLKQDSVKVKQGDILKQGQLIGLCGNSGNSSEAHLHFHVENIEDMNEATGAKVYFDNIIVNGQKKSDYSPIQNEKIKNDR
ncbi:MAG: peptidoglycan DD-metalloendopeptidase family protein [Cyanobacteriota bacterium]